MAEIIATKKTRNLFKEIKQSIVDIKARKAGKIMLHAAKITKKSKRKK